MTKLNLTIPEWNLSDYNYCRVTFDILEVTSVTPVETHPVELNTTPDDAKAVITDANGYTYGVNDTIIQLPIGEYSYTVSKEGYFTVNGTISVPTDNSITETLVKSDDYAIIVTTDGKGTASADKTRALEGATVTLTAEANAGYSFDKWEIITPAGLIIDDNSFIMPDGEVKVKAIFVQDGTDPDPDPDPKPDPDPDPKPDPDPDPDPKPDPDPDPKPDPDPDPDPKPDPDPTSPNVVVVPGGRGSSSRGGGGTTKPDISPNIAPSGNATTNVAKADATKLFNEAIKNKNKDSNAVSIKLRNIVKLEKAALEEFAALAKSNNVVLTIHADIVVDNAVVLRLSINPDIIKSDISFNLIKVEGSKIVIPEFALPVDIAVKLPAGIKMDGLKITQNGKELTNANPWLDKNGYVHFKTTGGTIVLSN